MRHEISQWCCRVWYRNHRLEVLKNETAVIGRDCINGRYIFNVRIGRRGESGVIQWLHMTGKSTCLADTQTSFSRC